MDAESLSWCQVGGMLEGIFGIIAGLVLLMGIIGALPFFGKYLEKLAKWLGMFQTIIGIIALIIGILALFSLIGIMLVVAGLVLLTGILPMIPALGTHLEKLAKWLAAFQVPIGVITLIVGIWVLL